MVRKRSKYNINSGCTFKFGVMAPTYRYTSPQQFLLQKLFRHRHIQQANFQLLNERIMDSCDKLIRDGGIVYHQPNQHRWSRDANVPLYSLNKLKRWLLPEMISDAIDEHRSNEEQEPSEEDNRFRVTLIERSLDPISWHWSYGSKNQADVTAYHDSTLYEPHVYPSIGKKYSFHTDLLKKGKKEPKKDGDKKRNVYHNQRVRSDQQRSFVRPTVWGEPREDSVEQRVPEVQYEICTSKPALHGHPRLKTFRESDFWYKSGKKAKKKGKSQRKKWIQQETGYTAKEFSRLHRLALEEIAALEEDYCNTVSDLKAEEDVVTFASEMLGEKEDVMKMEENDWKIAARESLTASLYDVLNKASHTAYDSGKPSKRVAVPKEASGQKVKRKGKCEVVKVEDPMFWEDFPIKQKTERNIVTTSSSMENQLETSHSESELSKLLHENTCFHPILTLVSEDSIHPKKLEELFEDRYMEGLSIPRRFTLRLDASNSCQTENFVVFQPLGDVAAGRWSVDGGVYDKNPDNHMWTMIGMAVKISITLRCHIPNDELYVVHRDIGEHLSGDTVHTLPEIADYIQQYLNTQQPQLQDKQLDQQKLSGQQHGLIPTPELFSTLTHVNAWTVDCFKQEDAFRALRDEKLVLHRSKLKQHSRSVVAKNSTGSDDLVCDICFDPIISKGGVTCGSAMKSCDHWFCDNCWCCHLVGRVLQGDLQLSCPGYGCDSVVDMASVLALLPYSVFVRHQRHLHDARLESSGHWKWCTQPKCKVVIRAKPRDTVQNPLPLTSDQTDADALESDIIEERICVSCTCHAAWCFDCLEEPHWPARCKQAAIYVKQVQQRGDESERPGSVYFVDVKRCPVCRQPMEKSGGCQHMSCRCGGQFCWECLQDWTTHNWELCLKTNKKEEHIELNNAQSVGMHEQFYQMAIKHRKARKLLLKQKSNTQMFMYEWHFLLEWTYVAMSSSTYRHIRQARVKHLLTTLNFLLNIIYEKLLYEGKHGVNSTAQVEVLRRSGEKLFRNICTRMKRMQINIHHTQVKQKMK